MGKEGKVMAANDRNRIVSWEEYEMLFRLAKMSEPEHAEHLWHLLTENTSCVMMPKETEEEG